MADLIDREELLEKIYGSNPYETSIVKFIKDQPPADTERHAHWIFQSETSSAFDKKYKCSKCNMVIVVFDEKDLIHYPYCNCGCKMDEVTGNE